MGAQEHAEMQSCTFSSRRTRYCQTRRKGKSMIRWIYQILSPISCHLHLSSWSSSSSIVIVRINMNNFDRVARKRSSKEEVEGEEVTISIMSTMIITMIMMIIHGMINIMIMMIIGMMLTLMITNYDHDEQPNESSDNQGYVWSYWCLWPSTLYQIMMMVIMMTDCNSQEVSVPQWISSTWCLEAGWEEWEAWEEVIIIIIVVIVIITIIINVIFIIFLSILVVIIHNKSFYKIVLFIIFGMGWMSQTIRQKLSPNLKVLLSNSHWWWS